METQIHISDFCANVRALRLKHKLTIPEMARLLELRPELLTLLETGTLTDEITIQILYCIHDHFGFTANQMFSPDFIP